MNPEPTQQILRDIFGDAAGALEIVAQTDRGPVWAFALAGDSEHVRDNWERLRDAVARLELWPLLVLKNGAEEDMRGFAEAHTFNTDHANHDSFAVLAEGLNVNIEQWVHGRQEANARAKADNEAYLQSPEYQAFLSSPEYQAWQQAELEPDDFEDENPFEEDDWATNEYLAAYPDGEEEAVGREDEIQHPTATWLLLVPARHGWEVPATVCFGGWNSCPMPHQHVALLHHWNLLYGAELVGLSHDQMLLTVARTPQNREEALPLAYQHFFFCSGEGWNEEDSPEMLVNGLLRRRSWWFWWD